MATCETNVKHRYFFDIKDEQYTALDNTVLPLLAGTLGGLLTGIAAEMNLPNERGPPKAFGSLLEVALKTREIGRKTGNGTGKRLRCSGTQRSFRCLRKASEDVRDPSRDFLARKRGSAAGKKERERPDTDRTLTGVTPASSWSLPSALDKRSRIPEERQRGRRMWEDRLCRPRPRGLERKNARGLKSWGQKPWEEAGIAVGCARKDRWNEDVDGVRREIWGKR